MARIFLILLPSVLAAYQVLAADWGYHGKTGPKFWPDKYPTCGEDQQSPINIRTWKTIQKDAKIDCEIYEDNIKGMTYSLGNNGHAAQVTLDKVPSNVFLSVFGQKFRPWQFHFHWGSNDRVGSEHKLNWKQFAGEMHFVHVNKKYASTDEALTKPDGLLVLGTFIEICDEDNPFFDKLVDHFDQIEFNGKNVPIPAIKLEDVMPEKKDDFYFYDGSLTTPECNEVVLWVVFKDKICMSSEQMERFRELRHDKAGSKHRKPTYLSDNFRPVQKLAGRKVYRSF